MDGIINKYATLLTETLLRLSPDEWVMIVFALLLCFFGLKFFKMSVTLSGLLFGGSIGYALGSSYFDVTGGVAGALFFALVCSLLFRGAVNAGFLVFGLLCGWFITSCFTDQTLWIVIGAVWACILSLIFKDLFLIVLTALLGAFLLFSIVCRIDPQLFYNHPTVLPALQGLLSLAGFSCQVRKPGVKA